MERLRFKLLELKFWLYWKLTELKTRTTRVFARYAMHPHLTIAELLFVVFILTISLSFFGRNGYLLSTAAFFLISFIFNLLLSYRTKRITGNWG
jgi:hypothetical protein